MEETEKRSGRLSEGLRPVTGREEEKRPQLTGKDDVRERYNRERDMSKITVIPARQQPGLTDPRQRKRVVVYCRVSTDGISQVSSFELQKSYYLKMVRQRPEWRLVGLYSDEGLSGGSIKIVQN